MSTQFEVEQVVLDEQVAAFESAGVIVRNNSPVILQWPWENGVPLAHGSMAQRLKEVPDQKILRAGVRDLVMVCKIFSFLIAVCD